MVGVGARPGLGEPPRSRQRIVPGPLSGYDPRPSTMEDLGETLRMPEPGDRPSAVPEGCSLVFLEGPRAGEVVSIERDRIMVGRADDADLILATRSVSKEHCVLTKDGHAFSVEDLNSTNGVVVNGTRLASGRPRRLFHGDTVRIAESLAMFQQAGCFRDDSGESRIEIDRSQVKAEVDKLMGQYADWMQGEAQD